MNDTIVHEFYIFEDSTNRLFWHEKNPTSNILGVYKFWLQSIDLTPRILFVLPDWQIIIDDVWLEKKFYSEMELSHDVREVKLLYNEYQFVFLFQ
jgi:hypothetical protein